MKSTPCLRSFLVVLAAGCWLVAQPTALAQAPAPAEPTKAAIVKLLNDFLAFNSDPARHDRFWADDLVYTANTGKVKTKAEIMQALADAAKAGAAKSAGPQPVYSADDVLVRVYGTTAALTFRLVARSPDGTTAYFRNSGTLLLRDGRWQVVTWQATRVSPEAR